MNRVTLAVTWMDSKYVNFLSTLHKPGYDNEVPEEDRFLKHEGNKGQQEGVIVPAPPYVKDYSQNMRGIDFSDKIIKYYNCCRRSKKWCRRFLFYLHEVSIHNAYILESYFVYYHIGNRFVRKR